MISTISKWGNSLGIRIPQNVLHATHLTDGDRIHITAQSDGSILITKDEPRTFAELIAGFEGELRCTEDDWGEDVGRERPEAYDREARHADSKPR